MALTQTQIIQSLGEALSWFEKELSWGVDPAELRHLTGRIGELYAAMTTRGQMAPETNQRGYDVISGQNERISVKTITSSNHVSFNGMTFDQIDRIMILRLNVDEDEGISIECLLDKSAEDAQDSFVGEGTRFRYPVASISRSARPVENLSIVARAHFGDLDILEYENGTIRVSRSGVMIAPAKPHLRAIAAEIGFDTVNESGNEKNTRQIGSGVIKILNDLDQQRQSRVLDALSKFLPDT